jgi:hypothetical protein
MTRFAKRHYEAIATAMQEAHPGQVQSKEGEACRLQWSETVKDLAEMFERDNRAFKIIRFVRACQPGANVRARA